MSELVSELVSEIMSEIMSTGKISVNGFLRGESKVPTSSLLSSVRPFAAEFYRTQYVSLRSQNLPRYQHTE